MLELKMLQYFLVVFSKEPKIHFDFIFFAFNFANFKKGSDQGRIGVFGKGS